ncbi:MAG: type I-E CRISPR-associated protein Cse1/CasA [Candidatus Riflebacteria bacterium HGW-Riflebacteria-1]|jgi:CRISPR system Cascade subunit CasA|nr:MAG: type I-E CRISPR-associated protein Cse1/CasA [Candidatus Riflebacteria bacterium HGW-Riflebacteria-1]
MHNYEHCLLSDKLIQVRKTDGNEHELTLPEVLACLTRNEIEAFITLQKHQQHSWHAFLVQLAAMTLHKHQLAYCDSVEKWKEMLLTMTNGEYEAWSLIVPNLAKPAFMQSPVPEGNLTSFKTDNGDSPDLIDLLNTAKNHDVKMKRIINPRYSHWLYALISLQTMQGVMGRGNYGIARMNGGFGSRPCATFRSSHLPGKVFIDDIEKCLNGRNKILEAYEHYKSEDGICLLWLKAWNGKTQIELSELNPFFIEICRRIRLVKQANRIIASLQNSKSARILAKDLNGRTGDPWTPVNKEEQKALSVSSKGFDYQLTQEIIFGNVYKAGVTQEIKQDAKQAFFWGSVLVRGKGETEGYHERSVKIPAKARKMLATVSGKDKVGEQSKKWVNIASVIEKNVLLPALKKLLNDDLRKAMPWLARFTTKVDQKFFPKLWSGIELQDEEANRLWEIELLNTAHEILQTAIKRLPTASVSFYRISCEAEGMFIGCKRKRFQHLFVKEKTDGSA